MSLLLDALKKAEQAKQAAAAREQAASLATSDATTQVMTRDRLPDLAGLELVPEDLAPPPRTPSASSRPAPDLPPSLQINDELASSAGRKPAETRRTPARPAEEVAAERQAVRQVFEAKQTEYNPKRGYYATLGLLGLIGLGAVGYFWWELQPKSTFVVANAPPPAPPPPTSPTQAATPRPGTAAPAPTLQAPPAAAAPAPPSSPGAPVSGVAPAPSADAPRSAAVSGPTAFNEAIDTRGAAAAPARPLAPTIPVPPQPAQSAAATRSRPAPATTPFEGTPVERRTPVAIVPTRTLARELDAAYDAFDAGDFAGARQRYQQVLRADPTNRDAILGLAAIDVRAGDTGVAESRYLKLLEQDPRDPHAQAAMSALRPGQDPVQSESRLKTLIAQQPDSAPLQFALGNLYSGQSRWSEAQAAYFKAFSTDPDNADFAYNLAVSLDHLRQPRLALEYYQRALALSGERPVSFDRNRAATRARDLER